MTKTIGKSFAGLMLVATLPGLAAAQETSPPIGLDAVYKCAQETDETKRLACFDAATQQLKSAEDSGEIVTVTREDVEEERRNSFGFASSTLSTVRNLFTGAGGRESDLTAETVEEAEESATEMADAPAAAPSPAPAIRVSEPIEEINRITVPILKTETFGYESTRFFLANGQVWDQLDRGRFRVPKERNGVKNTVEIRRGALGSYVLQVNGSGKSIAVRRRR